MSSRKLMTQEEFDRYDWADVDECGRPKCWPTSFPVSSIELDHVCALSGSSPDFRLGWSMGELFYVKIVQPELPF